MLEFLEDNGLGVVAIVIGAFFLLVVFALTGSAIQMKRRKGKIREWAFRSGCDYVEGPMPARELASINDFATNEPGSEAVATNIIRGSRGVPFTLLDLRRTTTKQRGRRGNRNERTTSSDTCALFSLTSPLPGFYFNPITTAGLDTVYGKLLGGIMAIAESVDANPGRQRIPIPDRPGFLLISHDGDRPAPLFAAERARFFDDKCGWTVEAEGSWLLLTCNPAIYGHGFKRLSQSLVDAPNYDDFLSVALAIRGFCSD
jgi:hypothetical protein